MSKQKKEKKLADIARYQEEFDKAKNIKLKLEVFSKINQELNVNSKERHDFFKRNWSSLVPIIYNYEQALHVFLFFSLCSTQKIWSTVIALKGIKLWLKNKSAEQITAEYKNMLEPFASALSQPLQIIIAEDILKKLEQ